MVKRVYFLLGILAFLLSLNFVLAQSSVSDVSFSIVSTEDSEYDSNFNSEIYVIIILVVLVILVRLILLEYSKRNRYKRAIKVRDH